jgi:putative restriction endonuclease
MAPTLRKSELLETLLSAVEAGGYQALVTRETHPFRLTILKADEKESLEATVYIWNCTHGGKTRSADEYRVQLTGVVPQIAAHGRTLLLGWHERYGVFVAFDITKHDGQASSSPSIQVKEDVLLAAHTKSFAAYDRGNVEVAIAFRPEFFVEYVRQVPRIHGQHGAINPYIAALNDVAHLSDSDIEALPKQRREVVVTIRRKVREADFRGRVLSAYEHQCAMCGMQLRLVEAAHIVPVADTESTDETHNGVALCSVHHDAYDRNFISFTEAYQIEVSRTMEGQLRAANRVGGLASFKELLRPAIILPANRRDHPHPKYVRHSREVRRWRA